MNIYKLSEGVNLHIIESNKYKDISLFINFYSVSDKNDRICRALLTNIIGNSSKMYDSKKAITNKKDQLYGSSIGINNITVGQGHVFQVQGKMLNEKFTLENTNNEFFSFVNELISNPIINESTLKEAKDNLIDRSLRKLDRPTNFSMSRVFEIYGKDTFVENLAILKPEDINNINLDMLINSYDKMINNDCVDIYIVGEVDSNEIVNEFKKYDVINSHRIIADKSIIEVNPILKDVYFEEEKNITQSSLVITYKTNIIKRSEDFFALRVANALLGLVPASLLFQEVREKNSLCYSINSNILGEEGILVIKTLIDSNNSLKTIDLIKEQVEKIKKGEFSMDQVNDCLNLYISILNGVSDDISQTVSMLYTANLENRECDLDKDIEKIKLITKDQIINAFNMLELKLIYLLKDVK